MDPTEDRRQLVLDRLKRLEVELMKGNHPDDKLHLESTRQLMADLQAKWAKHPIHKEADMNFLKAFVTMLGIMSYLVFTIWASWGTANLLVPFLPQPVQPVTVYGIGFLIGLSIILAGSIPLLEFNKER